jgi:histidine ammonia-lyase
MAPVRRELDDAARPRIRAARELVDRIVARARRLRHHDGLRCAVGSGDPAGRLRELQLNLIRSHAAGVGEPLDEVETRAIMLLRANVLALGHSGVRRR